MKNLCKYPVACTFEDGTTWNNFPFNVRYAATIYSGLEGHSRSSPEALNVESFMFHNTYDWRSLRKAKKTKDPKDPNPKGREVVLKKKPFVFFLHKKMISGRARFVNRVSHNFANFIKLFQKHRSEYSGLLMDRGVPKAPLEYLIAFEEGLRNYSSDIHALGSHPLRSREHWGNIALWRKREAYIALGRFCLQRDPDYKQWDCFLFSDFQDRQTLAETYVRRHHPLSDGNDDVNFEGQMNFDWDSHVYVPAKRRANTKVKGEPAVKKQKTADQPKSKPMIYDVEKGCLVPFE